MMSGCVSPAARLPVGRSLTYRVERKGRGWSVVVNACATRPIADRRLAQRLARQLQAEADGLRHRGPETRA